MAPGNDFSPPFRMLTVRDWQRSRVPEVQPVSIERAIVLVILVVLAVWLISRVT